MAKTLVIAEKPSVGQDLARVLPGPFQKHMGAGERTTRWLESPEHLVTWAVGHLVQLAEPDEYDDKFKKWRMADLPIVPRQFKLVVRDERSEKQMKVVRDQLRRDDVAQVVNACDAGREGELIFTYIYEYVKAKKPVQRLWLNSMTNQAMREAFGQLRDGADLGALRDAAKSRSEADWIVGMNATRAATIRLRSSFDGAVSLGRVQTPTLAIIARREEEIRAFVPEPYWLVDATFEPVSGDPGRKYVGRFHAGAQPRLGSAQEASAIVSAVEGGAGEITKLEKTTRREKAPLLYDLTSLQREANTRFGFSARRTLSAAQRLYEEHKVLTYPRTNSRFLPTDMIPEIKPIAAIVGTQKEYARGAAYVTGLDLLPLDRVINDAKVTDHHAIIPTNSEHKLDKLSDDDRRIYDMVTRRFLAVFHPDAVFENTRLETTVLEHVFRTTGRVLMEAGWRGVYGEGGFDEKPASADDDTDNQQLPKLADDEELREAMKDSGIGTPATRAAIIERLIDVGYVERDGRSLVCTEKGLGVIRLLDDHALTQPSLTGHWEHRLSKIEEGAEARSKFMADIAEFANATVHTLDEKLKEVKIPRANLGPCPVCGHDIVENRKGFSCWSREDAGCGFVIWKLKAGKTFPPALARELIAKGRTEKPVTGFKGRSGRSFRAKLALMQTEDGKWRVEFDEPWAREGAKPPEADEPAAATADAAAAPADSSV